MVKNIIFLLIVVGAAAVVQGQDLSNVLGVSHVDGKYFLTDKNYLEEGADQVLATGSKVLKIYLTPPKYAWNSQWPTHVYDLRSMVQTPYYKTVFDKPFSTFVITAYSIGLGDNYWTTSISDQQRDEETRQFHDLTEYLLTTYKGSGKTFVLQQWEGDWAMRGSHEPAYDASYQPDETAIDGMIKWINARQAGISAARSEVKDTDVHVYGALEANLVEASMAGKPGVINSVLPHTTVDLASYSCYVSLTTPERLEKAIDFIVTNLPATAAFGPSAHSVYLGEFGYPENGSEGVQGVNGRMNSALAVVKSRGVKYAIYWEVYCNELRKTPTTGPASPPVNGNDAAVMGFWMMKPDGKPGMAWHRYRKALTTSDPGRAKTTAIKAALTQVFSDSFDRADGTDVGPCWSKASHYGTVNQSLKDHHLQLAIPDASHIPWGAMSLDLKNPAVMGRGLKTGDYFEVTIDRKSDDGMAGVELFHSDQYRQSMGMGKSSPFKTWNGTTWIPISYDDKGEVISFDWSKPHTLGVRFDSADGSFATFSYYIDGQYCGAWIVSTDKKTMDTIGLFAQSEVTSSVEFSDLKIFSSK